MDIGAWVQQSIGSQRVTHSLAAVSVLSTASLSSSFSLGLPPAPSQQVRFHRIFSLCKTLAKPTEAWKRRELGVPAEASTAPSAGHSASLQTNG